MASKLLSFFGKGARATGKGAKTVGKVEGATSAATKLGRFERPGGGR